MVSKYKFQLFLIFMFSTLISKSQVYDGLRIGAGVGGSIYLGSQMDSKISFNTYDKSEVKLGVNLQLYKALDNKNEIGFRYLNTELWSFKNFDQQALNTKINEFGVIYQRSLNENSDLYSNRIGFTHNLVLGLSIISYKARAYSIDPKAKKFKVLSSVGYGNEFTSTGLKRPDSQRALGGILGYNIGFRLSRIFSLYLENNFTLSSSNYINGNLASKSKVTNNGYTYSALTLYINLVSNSNRIGCPKF